MKTLSPQSRMMMNFGACFYCSYIAWNYKRWFVFRGLPDWFVWLRSTARDVKDGDPEIRAIINKRTVEARGEWALRKRRRNKERLVKLNSRNTVS